MTYGQLYIENWDLLIGYRDFLETASLPYKWRRKLEIEIKRLETVNGIIYRAKAHEKELQVDITCFQLNSKTCYENKLKHDPSPWKR